MVIQKAIDNLKDKPKDDKKAIAGGIAIALLIVLVFGWAFFFLRKIQRGDEQLQFGGGQQQEFLGSSVRDAQEALIQDFTDIDELRRVRNEGGSGQVQQGAYQEDYLGDGGSQFGGSGSEDY